MRMQRRAAILAVLTALSACDGGGYFDTIGPSMSAPLPVGETLYAGILTLRAGDGDIVELLDLEVDGASEGMMTPLAVDMRTLDVDTAIGGVTASDPGDTQPIVDALSSLRGFEFTGTGRDAGARAVDVILAVRADEPADIGISKLRLEYTVNGIRRAQSFDLALQICVDDPRPASCG